MPMQRCLLFEFVPHATPSAQALLQLLQITLTSQIQTTNSFEICPNCPLSLKQQSELLQQLFLLSVGERRKPGLNQVRSMIVSIVRFSEMVHLFVNLQDATLLNHFEHLQGLEWKHLPSSLLMTLRLKVFLYSTVYWPMNSAQVYCLFETRSPHRQQV